MKATLVIATCLVAVLGVAIGDDFYGYDNGFYGGNYGPAYVPYKAGGNQGGFFGLGGSTGSLCKSTSCNIRCGGSRYFIIANTSAHKCA